MLQLSWTPQVSLYSKAFKRVFTQKSSQDNIAKKNTSLTNDDYKKTTILPLKHRLIYNKARFMHKILSGKAPTYLVTEKSVYQPLFQKLLKKA